MTTRRDFLKMIGATCALGSIKPELLFSESMRKTKTIANPPLWRGFNVLDFFSPTKRNKSFSPSFSTEDDFKWMEEWGFNFVRVPMAYPSYIQFDNQGNPNKHITQEEVVRFDEAAIERVDKLLELAFKHHLHVSLNLHRAPGFCINAGFYEPYNLWKDEAAQQALYEHWGMWAKRYKQPVGGIKLVRI